MFVVSPAAFRLFGFGRRAARTGYFGNEAAHHARVTPFLGERLALFKHLNRSRYSALAEQYTGFAEDASVTSPFFGSVHGE